ncbi:hypothetical protein [Brevundimonas sp.]|jgi:hypothetical protein|uniref:hypothetical protein n=1 Tax=Brevundimonas sp. TaxID=1871086 RepID=UPI0037845B73
MSDTNIGNAETTEVSTETTTQVDKSYSQREVDDMMARMKSSLSKKLLKPYEDLGDPEVIRNVLTTHQQREQETALKRGEFDRVMSEFGSKKDAEIQKRDAIIREFKVEQPLLSLASQYRSVNPEQVKQLLKPAVRLNAEGEVEVIDTKTGSVRYDDSGSPLSVDKYVKEFLDANPHFTSATPATTNTQSNVNNSGTGAIDLKSLDLTRPEHRKIYAEARRNGRI